jgi:hypothetical protein
MTDFTNPSTQTSGHLVTAAEWNELVNNHKFFDETRYLELDMAESHAPTVIAVAPLEKGSSAAGTPCVSWHQRTFAAGTVQGCQWAKPIPPEYKDSPKLVVLGYMATATSGTVVVQGYVSSESIGDIGTAPTFDTVNAATITVPGTAASIFAATITLTNADSLAASDHATFHFQRVGTVAGTAGGNYIAKKAMFTYGI